MLFLCRTHVALIFKKLNEYGDTITIVNDIVKDVQLRYDTKPFMYIYRYWVEKHCHEHIYEDSEGNIIYDFSQHEFHVGGFCMIKGSFWRKEITAPTDAGGIQLGVGNDYDLSTGEVNAPYDYSIYTNENLPSYAVMQFIDVNGKLVKSNKIPIETDGNGCVINSSYDETEEFDETHRMWNF